MNELATALSRHLFSDPEARVYAVLDGASVPGLLEKLHGLKPEVVGTQAVEPTGASPCFQGNRMYVRTLGRLICIGPK